MSSNSTCKSWLQESLSNTHVYLWRFSAARWPCLPRTGDEWESSQGESLLQGSLLDYSRPSTCRRSKPRGVRLTHVLVILPLYSTTFMHPDSCRVFLSSHDWNVSLRLASINEENRIKEGGKKDILNRALRRGVDDVKRIYGWLFQKTNCDLEGTTGRRREVCSIMINTL